MKKMILTLVALLSMTSNTRCPPVNDSCDGTERQQGAQGSQGNES